MKAKVLCFILGMVLFAGCGKEERSTEESRDLSSESALVESSQAAIADSIESESSVTEESTGSSVQDMFGLMIEAAQSQIPAAKEQLGDTYKDLTITEGDGHTIVYTYTFSQQPEIAVDMEALKPTLVKGMKEVIDSTKGMFPDVKVQAIYLNPDGTEIGNIVITQDDVAGIADSTSAQ